MPRTCTICSHSQREAVDKALVAGEPLRNIAEHFGTSTTALHRHKEDHIRDLLAQARRRQEQDGRRQGDRLGRQVQEQERKSMEQALDLGRQLAAINASCVAILSEARQAGNGELALKAADRVLRQLEFQAKLLGELDERPQVNVLVSSEWQNVRATLLAALGPYPEARVAVAAQLMALESPNGHR